MFACNDVPTLTLDEKIRFWLYVIRTKPDDCWPWIAGYSSNQYPTFYLRHKTYMSSRVAYKLEHNTNLTGLLICHSCDNIECCNPKHLFTGTNKENKTDSINKKRHNFGSRNGANKLVEKNILEIRHTSLFRATTKELALKYNVKASTISHILRHDTWKHVV